MSNNQGVWCSKCYGDHYTNDCPEPVASVEAKEKCAVICPDDLSLKCNLEIGHYQEYHSDGHTDWLTTSPVAEPKPTPSTSIESRKDVVVAASRCIRHWHDTDNGGMVVSGEHVRQLWDAIAQLDTAKPQPDSSSLPGNPVVKGERECVFCGWKWFSVREDERCPYHDDHHRDSSSISTELESVEADYLLGRCLPLLDTLAHYGDKEAKEVRAEIAKYVTGLKGQSDGR